MAANQHNLVTDPREKMVLIGRMAKAGHALAKVRFKPNTLKQTPEEDLYIVISHRRGTKAIYRLPCTEYINNDWPQRAFHLKCSFQVLISIVDVYSEPIDEISKEEVIAVMGMEIRKKEDE